MILVLLLLALATAPDRPNPATTPGATNPAITQATIGATICNPHWSTKSIRPPASYTTALKREQLKNWGWTGTLAEFEEDHLVSLELGGAPRSPDNLWPQHWSEPWGARTKDKLEGRLHRLTCEGTITLEEAQKAIATDWITAYQKYMSGDVLPNSATLDHPDKRRRHAESKRQFAFNDWHRAHIAGCNTFHKLVCTWKGTP